jgi:hypothetical protein
MDKILKIGLFLLFPLQIVAQEAGDWSEFSDSTANTETALLFNDSRVVNGHSVETLEKGTFDLRITHRFGDAATGGSGRTLFGIDQATDIRIGFEYGITGNFMVGLGRSKGSGPLTEVWDGVAKYKILSQSEKMPVSLTVTGAAFFTSMKKATDTTLPTAFTRTAHRFSYSSQFIVARSFADMITIQLAPTWIHRNFVAYDDNNGLFSLGSVVKVKVYKKLSLIAEYYLNAGKRTYTGITPVNPLAAGVEIKTFAHNFQLVFMNSAGIGEAQFIPYTASKWSKGQFRLGFTISRHF